MIQGTSGSSRGTRITPNRELTRFEKAIINSTDWCVSFTKIERFDPDNFVDLLKSQGFSWIISLDYSNLSWSSADNLNQLVDNLDWAVDLSVFDQTSGNDYVEQVVATGPLWFLPMFNHVDYGPNYLQQVAATGAVWALDMSYQKETPRLTYIDQVKATGAVWFLPMLDQLGY